MSGLDSLSAECKFCGALLEPSHEGPCTNCGHQGKLLKASISGKVEFRGTLTVTSIREYYEQNRWVLVLNILLTVLLSVLGVFIAGLWGVAFGIVTGLLMIRFVPSGITKVREIQRR